MEIEILGRRAVDIIKSKWGLPKRGFLAGGSLANIIWELKSGNKAVVNDIDIFILDKLVDNVESQKDTLFDYKEKELNYYEGYNGVCYISVTKEFYSITESTRDDIFNTILYSSNKSDPSLVIKSFDLNCTRVGYSIDEDKIYFTKDFEEFIESGEIKICNIIKPSHTAIRMAKKSKELNVKLSVFELNLIQYSLNTIFTDILKTRFKYRYLEMYENYKDLLSPFFEIKRDSHLELYVKTIFGREDALYYLNPVLTKKVFNDDNLNRIFRSSEFLFYMRNVYGNKELSDIWKDIYYFWRDEEYLDKEVTKDEIDLLSKFARYAPESINNLRGMKFSEQIRIIKMFLEKFKDDPIIAISILESVKLDKDIKLDDQTALLLELSVRKKIIDDVKGKVGSILGVGDFVI